MHISNTLRGRVEAALSDPELARLTVGLEVSVRLEVGEAGFRIKFAEGRVALDEEITADARLSAPPDAWMLTLSSPPPPRYHAFTAMQLANPQFELTGEPIAIARARPGLERIFELVVQSASIPAATVPRELRQIKGRYSPLTVAEIEYEIYFEEAGKGPAVLFLHTAGADGRQYLGQMSDVGLAQNYRMFALDLPFHGRSMPPRNWSGESYRLTSDLYSSWCTAFIDQIIGEPAIVVGGSMGAAMAMVLAGSYPDKIRGIVAVEPPYQSKGRRNPFQNHVAVHGGLHNSAYVRGLMSPTSPEADRRRASWIYAQGGPGIYPGDLAFYSDEFDGAVVAPRIDGTRTPVALLSGTYDYSATPDDGRTLQNLIPGSMFVEMDGLGHFPMCEHPDHFRPFLEKALQFVVSEGK